MSAESFPERSAPGVFDVPRRPARILVVDDAAEMLDLLTAVLREAGHVAVPARGGAAAALLVEREPDGLDGFDLVLTDQRMPCLTGTELCAWIEAQQGPPVVLVTAYPDRGLEREAARSGAVHVLAKPFAIDHLLQLVAWLT